MNKADKVFFYTGLVLLFLVTWLTNSAIYPAIVFVLLCVIELVIIGKRKQKHIKEREKEIMKKIYREGI